jgi:hypothetical protein
VRSFGIGGRLLVATGALLFVAGAPADRQGEPDLFRRKRAPQPVFQGQPVFLRHRAGRWRRAGRPGGAVAGRRTTRDLNVATLQPVA